MAKNIVDAITGTDLPELCPACLDRKKRFNEDDAIKDAGFVVGHVHDGKCDRCTFCDVVRGKSRRGVISLQDIVELRDAQLDERSSEVGPSL